MFRSARRQPGVCIGSRHKAPKAPGGQGARREDPAGVLMEYAEEVDRAQHSQDG